MTSNLARFIRLARHRVYGIPLRQEEQMELEQTQAIHEFKVLTATLFEFELRMELFMPAKWSYSTLGPCVEFTVDGRTFLLVQGRENCQLFLQSDKKNILLATFSEDREFADRLLVALGDVLEAS